MKRRTFEEWLEVVYKMSYDEYLALNDFQQKALQMQYKGW